MKNLIRKWNPFLNLFKNTEFSRIKINLNDHNVVSVKKWYELVSQHLYCYEELVERIASKYLISTHLSKIWIDEYWKFILIAAKIQENYVLTQSNLPAENSLWVRCFPSVWVEQVWFTHMEFSEEYQSFSKFIFNKTFYPFPYSIYEDSNSDLKSYYNSTQSMYKRLFNTDPPSSLWESEEIRFNGDQSKILVNIYRLFVANNIKNSNK